MNYYPHHIGDYAKDTRALSQGEHGAYRLLMDEAYSTENGIDAEEIYAIACAKTPQEKRNADRVLGKFFALTDGRYHQKRIDLEVETYQEKRAKASASASKRWSKTDAKAMRTHSEGNANASETHQDRICETDAYPITNNQEPRKDLKGIPPPAGASQPDPIFGPCLEFLRGKDVGDKGARSMLARWRKDFGEQAVCEAISAAERGDITEPIPWINRFLENHKRPKFSAFSTVPPERL